MKRTKESSEKYENALISDEEYDRIVGEYKKIDGKKHQQTTIKSYRKIPAGRVCQIIYPTAMAGITWIQMITQGSTGMVTIYCIDGKIFQLDKPKDRTGKVYDVPYIAEREKMGMVLALELMKLCDETNRVQ